MSKLRRYIHDECYGVQLDAAGNYLLMGGSGDEYDNYSETNADGWSSDVWVSYLVVLDKQVGVRGREPKEGRTSKRTNS